MNRRHARGAMRARRMAGYTLLEVIVAFALLALALTLLLGTLSGAARQVRWSGDAGRAALHAQSLLDQVGVGQPIEPGEASGELDGGRYQWALDVRPWRDPSTPPDAPLEPAAPRLFEITLSVRWGEGRPGDRVELRTLRLAPASAEVAL
ncbi:MAG: prepilin-type N-terminal cleavage/methylation domain-containing protein [Pseudomonas sp.]|nr:prepilin-type N-terminal cleavage/methylation domain-containing protein [Pseudomonas sp.]